MATQLPRIDSLPPAEKAEQAKGAQTKLSQHSTCVAGLPCKKVASGYQCTGYGGAHIVTHELLAEGKRRFYYGLQGLTTGYSTSWGRPLYSEILDILCGRLPLRRI